MSKKPTERASNPPENPEREKARGERCERENKRADFALRGMVPVWEKEGQAARKSKENVK